MPIQLYTLSLAGFNERGIQAGDVIGYRPAGLPWTGKETCKHFLLVNVYYDDTQIGDLVSPWFEGGMTLSEWQARRAAVAGTVLHPPPMPRIIAPRRYNFDLEYLRDGWYPDLNIDAILDRSQSYQPFIFADVRVDSREPVAIFTDKFHGRPLYMKRRVAQ